MSFKEEEQFAKRARGEMMEEFSPAPSWKKRFKTGPPVEQNVFMKDEREQHSSWSSMARTPMFSVREVTSLQPYSVFSSHEDTSVSRWEACGEKKRGPSSTCPLPSCQKKIRQLRRHCQLNHLPRVLWDPSPDDRSPSPQELLTTLEALTAPLEKSLEELRQCVNRDFDKFPLMVSDLLLDRIRLLEHFCGFPHLTAQTDNLHFLVTPAGLIHWRVVMWMKVKIEEEVMGWESHTYAGASPSPAAQVSHPKCNTVTSQGIASSLTQGDRGSLSVVTGFRTPCVPSRSSVCPQPDTTHHTLGYVSKGWSAELLTRESYIVDSHFHLDRSRQMWECPQLSASKLFRLEAGRSPRISLPVRGGVTAYCNPRTFPSLSQITGDPAVKVAIGFHPRYVMNISPSELKVVMEQISTRLPHAAALGEIGLDRSEPVSAWGQQDAVFGQLCHFAQIRKPIVVCVQGIEGDALASDVHCRAFLIMQQNVNHEQVIHLHCFGGSREIVRLWLHYFPKTYFSISPQCLNFTPEQWDGVQEIPTKRLMVESDCPHFSRELGLQISTPLYLGEVVTQIAKKRGVPLGLLLCQLAKTTQQLYGISLP